MGREHAGPAGRVPPLAERGHRAERLGVEDDRRRRRVVGDREQVAHELNRGESRSEARPEDDGIVLVVEDPGDRRLRVDLLEIVLRQGHRGGLDDLRGEERLERFGHGERDEPGTGATRGPADEEGRARVVERAGNDEQLSERALVAARRAIRQQRRRGLVVEGRDGGIGLRRRSRGGRVPSTEPERARLSHCRPRRGF